MCVNEDTTGTYVLALLLGAPQRLKVGRLGRIEFVPGWYLYVGSALGAGGVRARLSRHLRHVGAGKRLHWHVDRLRDEAIWGGAWARASDKRLECQWVADLQGLPGAREVAPGFGASDCRCSAHLIGVSALPDESWLADVLGAERIILGHEELDELLRVLVAPYEEGPGADDVREEAALALGRYGAHAVGPLAALLEQDDRDTRWWATRALAAAGSDGAMAPLIGALADVDADVRACAALGLGQIGDGAAASALAATLSDESPFAASIASDALSMIGEPAVEALADLLAHENAQARVLAVRALSRIGTLSTGGPLLGMLEDSSYLVRYYAREALEALGVGMVYVAP